MLAVECHGLVLIFNVPCLGSHCHVAVAGVVGQYRALALVHLPIADETLRRWALCHGTLLQGGGHVAGLVPEQQLVHGTRHLLTHGKRAVTLVGGGCQFAEQRGGFATCCHAGAQLAVLCHAQCQECPLVLRYTIKRGIGLVANLHF